MRSEHPHSRSCVSDPTSIDSGSQLVANDPNHVEISHDSWNDKFEVS